MGLDGRGDADRFAARRRHMVDVDIAARGLDDRGVLAAMGAVPRERFVPPALAERAYDDRALPIAAGQTISQPYIVAAMAASAEVGPHDRVLEIGTGSGYGAAVLARLAAHVHTIERHEELAISAAEVLAELGVDNVEVECADGTLGAPEAGPFDVIVVTAAGPAVPEALIAQLADGGRLVMPVGPDVASQRLVRVRRLGTEIVEDDLGGVRFVPLVGEQGWSSGGS